MTSSETIINLQKRVAVVEGRHQGLIRQREGLLKDVDHLKSEVSILAKSSAVLKHLLDIMVKDELNKISKLVTFGLKTIFIDQKLEFKPVVTKRGEKIHVELKTTNNGVEGEFGSFGGSVAVIESFLLRVLCMLKMKLARFMVMDETFAAVGSEYISNTSALISKLSKSLGMDILLVTHQEEFKYHADHAYLVKESGDGAVMEKLK